MLRRTAPRPDADILADAIKVVPPPADEYQKRRELLMKYMEHLRAFKRNYDETSYQQLKMEINNLSQRPPQ